LQPIIAGASLVEDAFRDRIRFTETDFNLPRILAGDINPAWLAMQSAEYYQVNAHSGWLELKPERLPGLMALKERAAIRGDLLLAALPTLSRNSLYVVVNRSNGVHRILEKPPTDNSPAVRALWEALHSRFPTQLGAPQVRSNGLHASTQP
jgi:hypothetical protein